MMLKYTDLSHDLQEFQNKTNET